MEHQLHFLTYFVGIKTANQENEFLNLTFDWLNWKKKSSIDATLYFKIATKLELKKLLRISPKIIFL